jgi:tetratricopeptide (TPR) repeat protein
MWRWKEDVSRERLETHEAGSEAAISEERWMNTCGRRAEELEKGFSLVLPAICYSDRLTLDLGDVTLELIWFGKAGHYNGVSVAVVPEEDIAIIPSFLMHPGHLAPHPHGEYAELDVPRWIAVLEELLEGEDAVNRVICGIGDVWSRERAQTHLEYIRRLWNTVGDAEAAGKTLREIYAQCSLENEFAFVKEMDIYRDSGDEWVRPQHLTHVRLFFLQLKEELASEIILEGGTESLQASLDRIRDSRDAGAGIYVDEASINGIGYAFMNDGHVAEAIEVFRLNVEAFPASFNVYDSLAEAYMNDGDTEKATHNYKRSLELNSENENARQMLERLEATD